MLFWLARRTVSGLARLPYGRHQHRRRRPSPPSQPLDAATKDTLNGCLVFVVAPVGLGCLVVAGGMISSVLAGNPMVGVSGWVGIGALLLTAAFAIWLSARWISSGD
jgi:hypothetical protein